MSFGILKRIFILTLILAMVGVPSDSFAKAKRRSKRERIECKAVILSDATLGKMLYNKNVHRKVLPASTTKVMTAILVLERLSLEQYVTVSPRATNTTPTVIRLKPGERYKVKDLLYATIIQSANDAAIALAEAAAGSEASFVNLMNRRARQLGANNTKFANSNGLPTRRISQYTTAYDMYLIFREALRHSFFKMAIRYKYKTIYSASGRTISLKSHNKMMFMGWKNNVYGKTGYTRAAQACFVGSVQKKDRTLVIGVFGCQDRWDDIKYVVSRFGGVAL